MKSFIIIIVICLLIGPSIKVQSQTDSIIFKQKIDSLIIAFELLYSLPNDSTSENKYFNVFPNSFSCFNNVFGYSDSILFASKFNPGPLYYESILYIRTFFNLNTIDEYYFINKIIDICIDGKWYADGVGFFQKEMRTYINNNVYLVLNVLTERPKEEIVSFWRFYFDGPIPLKELPENLLRLKLLDEDIFSLMQKAYEYSLNSH